MSSNSNSKSCSSTGTDTGTETNATRTTEHVDIIQAVVDTTATTITGTTEQNAQAAASATTKNEPKVVNRVTGLRTIPATFNARLLSLGRAQKAGPAQRIARETRLFFTKAFQQPLKGESDSGSEPDGYSNSEFQADENELWATVAAPRPSARLMKELQREFEEGEVEAFVGDVVRLGWFD